MLFGYPCYTLKTIWTSFFSFILVQALLTLSDKLEKSNLQKI